MIDNNKVTISENSTCGFDIEYNNGRSNTQGIRYGISYNWQTIWLDRDILTTRQKKILIKKLYKHFHKKQTNDRLYINIHKQLCFENDQYYRILID